MNPIARRGMEHQPHRRQLGRGSGASRIPSFRSIEEAAEFWDTHSLADFEDELEEVTGVHFVVTRAQPKKPLTVRLEADALDALSRRARELGIGASTLARLWILEHLRSSTEKRSRAESSRSKEAHRRIAAPWRRTVATSRSSGPGAEPSSRE